MSHTGSTTFPGRCSGNKLLGKSAGKVKLLHRYKRGDPHLWKREAFQGALGSACTSPGTQVSCNGCSVLGMAQIICKNNPQMAGVPRNDPLLLGMETWASSWRGEMAEPQHSPNVPTLTAARAPTCRQEMKETMKRKMRVFSKAERRSTAHRQRERRWSLPDESRRAWKL